MAHKYLVDLTEEERGYLLDLINVSSVYYSPQVNSLSSF